MMVSEAEGGKSSPTDHRHETGWFGTLPFARLSMFKDPHPGGIES
jgi:hypothetical protein